MTASRRFWSGLIVGNDTVSLMADRYSQFADTPPGKFLVKQLGLPAPSELRRYEPGQELLDGPVFLGGAPGGRLAAPVGDVLEDFGVELIRDVGAGTETDERFGALVYDATGIHSTATLHDLYEFFHGSITRLGPSGRVLVIGTPPEQAGSVSEAIAQRALEGFTRSAAKEV